MDVTQNQAREETNHRYYGGCIELLRRTKCSYHCTPRVYGHCKWTLLCRMPPESGDTGVVYMVPPRMSIICSYDNGTIDPVSRWEEITLHILRQWSNFPTNSLLINSLGSQWRKINWSKIKGGRELGVYQSVWAFVYSAFTYCASNREGNEEDTQGILAPYPCARTKLAHRSCVMLLRWL